MHKTDPDRPRQRRFGHIAAMATLICAMPVAANATTRNVPGTYANIQAAINASVNGDVVSVAAGTYSGTGNIDITTGGRAITIQGAGATSTIINVNASSANEHQAFFIHNGETSSTVIRGFTIENAYDGPAGAMAIDNASPIVDQCIFLNNSGTQGGAINITDGSPKISDSVFINNVTRSDGGGEFGGAIEIINDTTNNGAGTVSNTVTIVNDSFIGNTSTGDGGAIDVTGEDVGTDAAVNSVPVVNIDNCSFSKNTAQNDGSNGGGVIDFFGGKVTISNSILYGDLSAEISIVDPPATGSVIQDSDIQLGYTGAGAGSGIVSFDPLFENASGNDLRLKAKSPAINDGTKISTSPTADLVGDTRDANIDMGAYEYLLAGNPTTISPTQGSAFNGQVATFLDTDGEVDTPGTFSATINWGDGNSSAGAVTQPGGSGTSYVVSGSHTYATSGAKTVTVTFTDSNPDGPHVTGSEAASETVNAAAATGFTVSAPSSATAGTSFNFTVTATAGGGATTNYSGTVHFTSSDGSAVLPANATLTNGVGSFSATLKTVGSQTITATDTVVSSITGTSGTITVNPAAATQIVVGGPNPVGSYNTYTFTYTAEDQFGNLASGYNGTVALTSSDPSFVNLGNVTLSNGVGQENGVLKTAGTQTITATDTSNASIKGTGSFTVLPGAATGFTVSAPANATAGTPVFFTVTAHDLFGNPVTSGPNKYSGTVHFTTSDRYGAVPADSPIEGGTGTFQATFGTVGTQTITATDSANSLTGTSGGTLVTFGPTVLFGFRVRSTTAVDGAPLVLNLYAYDHYGNQVTNYSGTVHFTSTDPNAVLPADTTLSGGQGSFNATLYTLGSQSITATDTVTSSITGTQSLTVTDNPATHFRVSASPATAIAGAPVTITVTAIDASGNTARGYTGTVHISSNAVGAVLPSNATLTNGTGTFQITFTTVGRFTITATDTANSSLTGTSGTVVVSGGEATQLKVTAQASAVANHQFGVVVQALDAYGNIATGYTGTVHLTSTDPSAVLPADGVLYSGQRTFLATLKTLGGQTVTATDTVNSGLTATTGTITITAH